MASFLLSVMGEGTFLDLLAFLERPRARSGDRRIARLPAHDEARHVAFGVAHLDAIVRTSTRRFAGPAARAPSSGATTRCSDTAGLNDDVFDALVLLAAGSWAPGGDRPRVAGGAAAAAPRWTKAAGAGSRASASPPTRRRSCRRCTPATSCEQDRSAGQRTHCRVGDLRDGAGPGAGDPVPVTRCR